MALTEVPDLVAMGLDEQLSMAELYMPFFDQDITTRTYNGLLGDLYRPN